MKKSRSFKRILGYVKPYWFSLLLNLFFNLVTIFFSLFSFALLVPLLNLLFQTEVVEAVVKPEFALTSDYLMS
jgi:subfamily B ATP-binding cassette protein MsbA